TVRRGVDAVRATLGASTSVSYEHGDAVHDATCRLVRAGAGRESGVRKSLGISLESTEAKVMLAGMLVDGVDDWPADQQADGGAGDFNFLLFPRADGPCRWWGG